MNRRNLFQMFGFAAVAAVVPAAAIATSNKCLDNLVVVAFNGSGTYSKEFHSWKEAEAFARRRDYFSGACLITVWYRINGERTYTLGMERSVYA